MSGYGPESGRAARAVRGRCGRLRATYTRSRDALPGSTGNGFVSGALFPLVASRAVCVGMRRYGSPVRCGFWHGMSRYGAPEVVRYVSLCFAMFRSLLRLGPPALSRRRRSSRLRDVALCRALSRAGDLRRSRPPLQWNVPKMGTFHERQRSPEVPAASPVERLPGLLRWLRIVSHWAGFFSGNRAAFRVPVPEYAPVRAPLGLQMSRCLSRYTSWCKWRAMARLLSLVYCPTVPP